MHISIHLSINKTSILYTIYIYLYKFVAIYKYYIMHILYKTIIYDIRIYIYIYIYIYINTKLYYNNRTIMYIYIIICVLLYCYNIQ